jgi:hypothetical protein
MEGLYGTFFDPFFKDNLSDPYNNTDIFKIPYFDFPKKPAYTGAVDLYSEVIMIPVLSGYKGSRHAHTEAYFYDHRPGIAE